MGLLNWLFGNRQQHTVKPRLANINDNAFYESNDDVITGYKYYATLHISTSLEILKHHGKIFHGLPSKAPTFGSQSDGIWLPLVNPEFKFLSSGIFSSDIGPIKPEEYMPFLIDFRGVIESDESHIEKLEQLKLLENTSKYKSIWTKLQRSYSDFPQSCFYSAFTKIDGIGIKTAKNIYETGFVSIDELLSAKDSDLLKIGGLGKSSIQKIKAHRMVPK